MFTRDASYLHRNELAELLILMRGHALVILAGVVVAWNLDAGMRPRASREVA